MNMHAYVVRLLEASGQTIVPGCIAEMTVKEGRYMATVKHIAPVKWVADRNGYFSPNGPPQATSGGTIKIKFTSEDINYDYYDFGNEETTWERIVRKSINEGKPVMNKAVKKNGIFYLKSEATELR
jgi:hypothetical protein